MKPVPKPRHTLAVMIMAMVAIGYGWLAMYDDSMSDEQFRDATVALKEHDPTLYQNDLTFGDSGIWQGHAPLFQAVLKMILVPTRYEDPMRPFRVLAGVLAFVYLCGMYGLVYRQCLSWSVSVFVAVLSSTVTTTLAHWQWGIGPLSMVTPAGICIAIIPLIVIGYLRNTCPTSEETRFGSGAYNWKLLAVFGCIGLLGNIHLATSINLTLIMVFAYLSGRKFSVRAIPMTLGCLAAACITAMPQAWYYLAMRGSLFVPQSQIDSAAIADSLKLADLDLGFSAVLRSLIGWVISCSVFILLAGAALVQMERFKVRNLRFWVSMWAGAFLVSVGIHGLFELVSVVWRREPLAIDFVRAATLMMLPIYILAGQTMANLFRMTRHHAGLLRWACIILAAVWMIPSDNMRVPRHWVYEKVTMFMAENDKPSILRRRHERLAKRAERRAIAAWARNENNTDKNAVFIGSDIEFRMLSRRSALATDDVQWTYRISPQNLTQWLDLRQKMSVLNPPAEKTDAASIKRLTTTLSAKPQWQNVKQWYVLLASGLAPPAGATLEYITSDKWGHHVVLARVR